MGVIKDHPLQLSPVIQAAVLLELYINHYPMGKKSAVWNYFEEISDTKANVCCKLCKAQVEAGDSNMSNLRHHKSNITQKGTL